MMRAGFAATVLVCSCAFFFVSPGFAQGTEYDEFEFKKAALTGDVSLSLSRSIELALETNPELVVEKLRVEQARVGIEEEKGFYDPVFDASGRVGRRDNVVASRFFPTGLFVEKDTIYGARLNGITHMGSRYGLNLNFHRQFSTSNTQSLSPQYAATMDLTFSQPLLRGRGSEVVLTRLRVAQREHEISEESLAIRVSTVIFQVVQAYWNLVFLREDLEVRRTSMALAQALLEQSESLLSAGRIAPVSVHEARAGMFERQEDVIRFQNEVARADDQLKALLNADLSTVTLIPRDPLEDMVTDLDAERSFDRAVGERPELSQLRTEIKQRQQETLFASNQIRPRLDLNLQYGMSGLSGRPNNTLVNPTALDFVTAGDTVAGSVFADITRPLGAFNRFFSGEGFDNWSVELRLELPLRNRTAKARLADANLSLRESQVRLQTTEGQVMMQIRDAMRTLSTARQSIDASRGAIRAVEEQLIAVRSRFEAGLTTSYEVLAVLDLLARARTRELRALMEQNIAQAALQMSEGSIMEEYNVEVGAVSKLGGGG